MPQIKPIKDLRNTNEISDLCHAKNEPVFITKNGYGDLVIMSIETYERELGRAEVYKKLSEAEQEISKGELLLEGEELFKKLKKRYDKK